MVGSSAAEGDTITATGERLRCAGGAISVNPITGKMSATPSGDDRIDAAACDIALRCATQDRPTRDRFAACVEAGYEAFLDSCFVATQG